MNATRRAYVTTALGAATIATTPIFVTLADVSPATAALWRAIYALPGLVGLLWLRGQPALGSHAATWIPLGMLSGAAFCLDLLLWYRAIALVGAGPGTLLVNTQLVWVTLFGAFWLGEHPSRAFWLVLPILGVGIVMMSGIDRHTLWGDAPAVGLVAGLAAGFAYAVSIVALREAQRRGAPSAEAVLVVEMVTTLAALLLTSGGRAALAEPWTWATHRWLMAVGVLVQVVAWSAITRGLPRLPSHHGAVLLLLQPVGALLLGWLVLDQALPTRQLAGAALVLVGLASALR